jgi:outer membrane protein OmpU
MKKQLMTTTALVAAGVIASSGAALGASKPKLSLGGYFEAILGASDQDEKATGIGNRVGVDVQHDSEIYFNGSVTLDNGIKIRTRTELEGQSANSADTIDEAYMAISGKFGEIRIGSEDNVAHLMTTRVSGSWATGVGQNLSFDVPDWIERPTGLGISSVNRLDLGDADAEKISYFTPRFSGLQLGLTYTPSFNEGENGTPEETASGHHHGFSAAVSYKGKMGGAKVDAAAGYSRAKPDSDSQNWSEPQGMAVGAKVTFGKITVAAGYQREWNLESDQTSVTNDGQTAIDLGIQYNLGKNKFSLGYNTTESKGTVAAGEDEYQSAMLSYRRDLGPGVQYRLNVMYGDWEGEDVGTADDNDGYAITTSVRLAF